METQYKSKGVSPFMLIGLLAAFLVLGFALLDRQGMLPEIPSGPFHIAESSAASAEAPVDMASYHIPEALPDVPEYPEHIQNHPRQNAANPKMAAWNTIWNYLLSGGSPDWCGTGPDGAKIVVFYGLEILRTVEGKLTGGVRKGLALVFNYNSGDTTAMYSLNPGPDGKPTGGGDLSRFEKSDCPSGSDGLLPS